MIGRVESGLKSQAPDSQSHSEDRRGQEALKCLKEFGTWAKRYGHLWTGDTNLERGIKTKKIELSHRLVRLQEILSTSA